MLKKKKHPQTLVMNKKMAHELIDDSPMKQKSTVTEDNIPNVCLNMNDLISNHRLSKQHWGRKMPIIVKSELETIDTHTPCTEIHTKGSKF